MSSWSPETYLWHLKVDTRQGFLASPEELGNGFGKMQAVINFPDCSQAEEEL